ncbi:DUF3489 domain-containing protein [Sandarakinorhabdus sp.]|uniref:DUF3489 domain-containing protein n=1 Tax=Sandarakinorhabdus sp. TaxID=1916663 RepID=UPI003341738A
MTIRKSVAERDAPKTPAALVTPVTPVAPDPLPRVSKPSLIRARLEANGGASLAELVEATGWQPHSIRAAMTGLRKQGLTIEKTLVDGVTRFAIVVPEVIG